MEKTQHKGVGELTKNIIGFQSAEDIHLEHSKSCMMSSTWCHVTKVSSFAQHLILAAASTSTEYNSQNTRPNPVIMGLLESPGNMFSIMGSFVQFG